jgi:hypothetical protein
MQPGKRSSTKLMRYAWLSLGAPISPASAFIPVRAWWPAAPVETFASFSRATGDVVLIFPTRH